MEDVQERYSTDGEITTSFEDVAEEMARDDQLQRAGSDPETIKDRIMRHLDSMTIADLVRQAIAGSDVEEVEAVLEVLKEDASDG